MKTKVVALLMALAMVCSMAACGAKEEAPAEAPATEEKVEEEAPAEEPAEEIVLSYQTPNATDMITIAFAEYQKTHPNVSLDVQVVDNTTLQTKFFSQLETGTLTDFGWMNGTHWRDGLQNTDSVLDLTDIIAEEFGEGFFHKDTFLQCVGADGRIPCFPAEMQIQGFLINPSLFEKYGLEIPKTFEDLLNCAKVFRENGITLFGSGTKDAWPTWPWYHWYTLWGTFEQAEDVFVDHSITWAEADASTIYGKLAELHEAGAFPDNNATITYEQSKIMFVAEQCAALPTSTDQLAGVVGSDLDKAGKVEYWFGTTFTDSPYNQNVAVKLVNNGFGISANISEEKLAVLIDFFKFFYSPEAQEVLIKDGITLPIMSEVNTDGASHLVSTIVDLVQETQNDSVITASYSWFNLHNMDVQHFLDFTITQEALMNGLIDGSKTAADIPETLETMDAQIVAGIESWNALQAQ